MPELRSLFRAQSPNASRSPFAVFAMLRQWGARPWSGLRNTIQTHAQVHCSEPTSGCHDLRRQITNPLSVQQSSQIVAIVAGALGGDRSQLIRVDESFVERNFFQASNLQALPLFNRLHEVRRLG